MSVLADSVDYEWWPAPAKVNLMLRVLNRRDDGYHNLQTVFQFIGLYDWLGFAPAEDQQITLVSDMSEAVGEDNLVLKAARLIQGRSGCARGVRICLDKRIPTGAGLGGGSSDAATVLLVLNQLWQVGLTIEDLSTLGVQLGADVPVFIRGYNAWAEGVGEDLQPLELLPYWFVIIKPECHISTKKIFTSKYLTRDNKSIRIADFMQGAVMNDCLPAVAAEYPEVKLALEDLKKYSEARLTGTGACVFGLFDDRDAAYRAAKSLSEKWRLYVVRSLAGSPLLDMLA